MTVSLIGTDVHRSTLCLLNNGATTLLSFSPFGNNPRESDAQGDIPGFNGERRDPMTLATHLGNGYRAFSPVLNRFTCPDDSSPFGEGGINAYAYCYSDPINQTDPSGRGLLEALEEMTGNLVDRIAPQPATGVQVTNPNRLLGFTNFFFGGWFRNSRRESRVDNIAARLTGADNGGIENPENSSQRRRMPLVNNLGHPDFSLFGFSGNELGGPPSYDEAVNAGLPSYDEALGLPHTSVAANTVNDRSPSNSGPPNFSIAGYVSHNNGRSSPALFGDLHDNATQFVSREQLRHARIHGPNGGRSGMTPDQVLNHIRENVWGTGADDKPLVFIANNIFTKFAHQLAQDINRPVAYLPRGHDVQYPAGNPDQLNINEITAIDPRTGNSYFVKLKIVNP
jgi:RHS repeat-associated protein